MIYPINTIGGLYCIYSRLTFVPLHHSAPLTTHSQPVTIPARDTGEYSGIGPHSKFGTLPQNSTPNTYSFTLSNYL